MAGSPQRVVPDAMHAIAILGNDAWLAALPARPVQLMHACLEAGYTLAIPASWGDELVANETLRVVGARGHEPAIACSCPHVAERLTAAGEDLSPFLVPLVAPPVAAARYVREVYGDKEVHLTYIGNCPASADRIFQVRWTPEQFLGMLRVRRIDVLAQPEYFVSSIPPDRRRHSSLPGGVPSPEILFSEGGGRALVELDADDISAELAQLLVAKEFALIDLAPRLGCACSGVMPRITNRRSARVQVASLEPPRSLVHILDASVSVDLTAPSPVVRHVRRGLSSLDLVHPMGEGVSDQGSRGSRPVEKGAPAVGKSAEGGESFFAWLETIQLPDLPSAPSIRDLTKEGAQPEFVAGVPLARELFGDAEPLRSIETPFKDAPVAPTVTVEGGTPIVRQSAPSAPSETQETRPPARRRPSFGRVFGPRRRTFRDAPASEVVEAGDIDVTPPLAAAPVADVVPEIEEIVPVAPVEMPEVILPIVEAAPPPVAAAPPVSVIEEPIVVPPAPAPPRVETKPESTAFSRPTVLEPEILREPVREETRPRITRSAIPQPSLNTPLESVSELYARLQRSQGSPIADKAALRKTGGFGWSDVLFVLVAAILITIALVVLFSFKGRAVLMPANGAEDGAAPAAPRPVDAVESTLALGNGFRVSFDGPRNA